MKIKDYMKRLASVSDFVTDFSWRAVPSSFIDDVFQDMADDGVSIYTDAQVKFALDNPDAVQEAAMNGLLLDATEYLKHSNTDFRNYCATVGVAAWYEMNRQEIEDCRKECIQYAICDYLADELHIEEVDGEVIDEIESIDPYEHDTFGEYLDDIKGAIEE